MILPGQLQFIIIGLPPDTARPRGARFPTLDIARPRGAHFPTVIRRLEELKDQAHKIDAPYGKEFRIELVTAPNTLRHGKV